MNMNPFRDNSLFVFVDDLHTADSPNFVAEGKIVELLDTGSDARAPGDALKVPQYSSIPGIRNSFKSPPEKDQTAIEQSGDNGIPITGSCAASTKGKGMMFDSLRYQAPINSASISPNDAERIEVNSGKEKLKPISGRTWMYTKHSETNHVKKSEPANFSVPEETNETTKVTPPARKMSERRPMSHQVRFATSPRSSSLMKTSISMVTSEASMNQLGTKKFIHRAVDKDSLSNCSRELDATKTSAIPTFASRLPRSSRLTPSMLPTTNFFMKGKSYSPGGPELIRNGKELGKCDPEKEVMGDTVKKPQQKDVECKSTRINRNSSMLQRRYGSDGRVKSNVTLTTTPKPFSQGKPATCKYYTSLAKSSSSKSKIATGKAPITRFGKNVVDMTKDQPLEGSAGKGTKTEVSGTKISDANYSIYKERASDSEKVPARPSAKNHDLTRRENHPTNSTTSIKTKLPKPQIFSAVPKLMNEFVLQQKMRNEDSSKPAVPSFSPGVQMRKSKTEANRNLDNCSEILQSDELAERLSRFSSRPEVALSSKSPLLSRVTGSTCSEQVHEKGVVDPVKKNEEEIELTTILADAEEVKDRKTTSEPPKANKSYGPKRNPTTSFVRRQSTPLNHPTGSKVPRPMATNCVRKQETISTSSAKSRPKKQEAVSSRAKINSIARSKQEKRPATSQKRSVEAEPVAETSADGPPSEEDTDEDVEIPIMNRLPRNVELFATNSHKIANMNGSVPQEAAQGQKLASWVESHKHAYLKGRAIGLKVANMARAARKELKLEFVRSGLEQTPPMSQRHQAQEIVDVGISVIEKFLVEKNTKTHSPTVRGDEAFNYLELDENIKCNNREWFT